jgi:dienelactone hydrolase
MPPWNKCQLIETIPATFPTEQLAVEGIQSLFYEGLDYRDRPTRIYAYYGVPEGTMPQEGWPGVVLVHGGGGTAFHEWVTIWNQRGYAAIAMDLEGHLPDLERGHDERPGHEGAGPCRVQIFADCALPVAEQWMYHAVADVVLAHSLIRSLPEVNAAKTGITGISWGGILTCCAMGLDNRFCFAIPVYGCGYLYEADTMMGKAFAEMEIELRKRAACLWDPSVYIKDAEMPTLWINGQDAHFPLDSFMQSYADVGGSRFLRLQIGMAHSHQAGWAPEEIYRFADSVVGQGVPLAAVAAPVREGHAICAAYISEVEIVRAELCYTRNGGEWLRREWRSSAAISDGARVRADLPAGTVACFFNLVDNRGGLNSSPVDIIG